MSALQLTPTTIMNGAYLVNPAVRRITPATTAFIHCLILVALLAVATFNVNAQEVSPKALDFAAAKNRLLDRSDALEAANAEVRSKEAQERSTRTLRRPDISADIQVIEYEKTLDLTLTTLGPIAEQFGFPNPIEFEQRDTVFRPIISATLPIYAGGKIRATQSGAIAQVAGAEAEREEILDQLLLNLIRNYYGQQFAAKAMTVRKDVLDGLERHKSDVEKLEVEGIASKAQKLQAYVARDDAARRYQTSVANLASARAALGGILRLPEGVKPSSPLFVISTPLLPLEHYKSAAQYNHPSLKRIDALRNQADAAVKIENSRRKPEVFGFGQYNLNAQNALISDPDWTIGVGFRYKFLSGQNRNESLRSAKETRNRAAATRRETEVQVDIGVTRAWYQANAARERFLLQDNAIISAKESLRLQTLAHREQQATSLDVIDAQLGLERAQIEQAQAAYEFIVAIAELARLSGDLKNFELLPAKADRIIQ
ncbi:TolC family protein [Kordiimonas sp. SCSIO 12610]|uniref:TolC family protein n=1 Tax=Kordiimonas sp. SCSIO 12610 TaxID=2829597 RepID=UPI00210AC17D|nr:TolC family protein [Kordiimonas sp. SCSIO 12610]UTW55674.1 TolC family protein [Kordiimonas sp. SCSIO 12610]